MKNIATLTINPTVDKSTNVKRVVPEDKLRCERPEREPGGGGINVSRAIDRLGGTSTLLYQAGGPTGEMLQQLLEKEGLKQQVLPIEDWTRENLIVYEEASGRQYRFGMPGPQTSEDEWKRSLEALAALDPAPDYIVASGSLAPGVPEDFYAQIAVRANEIGARLIVDTSGPALRRAIEAGAYLFKPNMREFQALVGRKVTSEQEQIAAARELIREGCCTVVVVSLGAGGALVITADRSEHVRTPTVPIRSKVGAGDSMVAGIVLGLAREMDLMDAVRFGVAAGAAAVMTEGTQLCRRDDTERLFEKLQTAPTHS